MKNTIKYWLVILSLAAATLQSCQETAIKPEDTQDGLTKVSDFPLAPGSTWEYKIINNISGDKVADYIVTIVKSSDMVPQFSNGDISFPAFFKDTLANINNNEIYDYWSFQLKPYWPLAGTHGDTLKTTMDPSGYLAIDWMIFPLKVGDSWQTLLKNFPVPTSPGSVDLLVVSRVLNLVNIEVEAGTFLNAYRLQRNYFLNAQQMYIEDLEDFYPGVGLVNIRLREVEKKTATVLHDYRIELVRYKIK